MAELPNVDDIIKANPNVDPEELEKGRALLRQVRERRVHGAGRKLPSPLTRRRALIDQDPRKDPRTVELRTRR